MIRQLIALCGRAGAGKDTAASLLIDTVIADYPKDAVVITGFALRLKEALRVMLDIDFHHMDREEKERPLDWLGKSPRELMQTLGTEWGRGIHPDLWVLLMEREIFDHPQRGSQVVILTDCRFPNEISWVKRKGGAVWWIERDGIAPVKSHSSEASIGPQDCDRTIPNFGTKADLEVQVRRAWEQLVVTRRIA